MIIDFGSPSDQLHVPLIFSGTVLRTVPEVHEYFDQHYQALAIAFSVKFPIGRL